ncbi:DUF3993 domain-containing protein [Ectobacillus antri]|jgi:hypothetical protein|uniref:DUF3993 domain-containing protein n=1 Tax=Ectobacillus antri TaxID=2486280 RepID=A0ABT6H1D5_9BACI|nr:DUF3993 domain-containing protein [Ectobacillus antri]MDG4655760.1 DUF3993 domain-containing protein [Ectobacillus antri]MDG5752435.1 DUF3993 domain-containing protein [Ectobacillus antri]
MRKYGAWVGFCLLLAFIIGQSVASAIGENEQIDKQEIYGTIEAGYAAQYKIRGKQWAPEKMYDILTPYFTNNFLQVFTDENSGDTKASGGYLLKEKAPFSFGSATKVTYDDEHNLVYVYEKIEKKKVYEVVTLVKEQGKWKIGGYNAYETLPKEIVK